MVLNVAQPVDKNSRTITQPPALKMAQEVDGNGLPLYIGYAVPGTAQSTAKWSIMKMSYSGTNLTKTEFADGTNEFSKEWDERTSYNYSS